METATVRPFSIAEALRFGWETLKSNMNPLVVYGAIGAVLALVNSALQRGKGAILALGVQVLQALLLLVMIRVALKLLDGAKVELGDSAKYFNGFVTYLLTSILYGLIVFGGMVLLIVPGVIWGVQFGFSLFLSAERGLQPIEALKESSRLTRGVRWYLFEYALAVLGVNLLGMIALGVGVIFTVPLTVVSTAWVFRRLVDREPQEAAPVPPTFPTPKPA